MAPQTIALEVVRDIREIPAEEWNRLAGVPGVTPFLEHEFLASLEETGCIAPETGWYPFHLVLREKGTIIAAAPLYGKTHSMGEFVFDHGWARAAESMGKTYYPKLVGTIPFTNSPKYRFLLDPDRDPGELTSWLLAGMRKLRDDGEFGGISLLFVDAEWEPHLQAVGGLGRWAHQYFVWENPGHQDFEDYLRGFKKGQRKNIRHERRGVREAGVEVRIITGADLTDDLMNRMYDFYEGTNEQFGPWAAFFLNREWFVDIGRRWPDRVVLVGAWKTGETEPVALSFLVRKDDSLTGRYWGAGEFVKHLHFELCYYAPIEYAIAQGIAAFDPGMGSPHKARRGFVSREYGSYHEFADPELTALFRSYIPQVNEYERENIRELNQMIPRKITIESEEKTP